MVKLTTGGKKIVLPGKTRQSQSKEPCEKKMLMDKIGIMKDGHFEESLSLGYRRKEFSTECVYFDYFVTELLLCFSLFLFGRWVLYH